MTTSLAKLSARYPLWLCDIWGVVHNGRDSFPAAVHALSMHRAGGGAVALVTNSPRSEQCVTQQLHDIGVSADAYDTVVTSGDVTRDLVSAHGAQGVFLIGPQRDLSIFDGLDVPRLPLDQAAAVLVTGLADDEVEIPDQYRPLLIDLKERGLIMICANPDKIVRRGSKLVYCAGSLADIYTEMGGTVLMAGKPFPPIYALALERAFQKTGVRFAKDQILAIGDGPDTDIKGAADFDVPVLLISGGIHDRAMSLQEVERQVRAHVPDAHIALTLQDLVWP